MYSIGMEYLNWTNKRVFPEVSSRVTETNWIYRVQDNSDFILISLGGSALASLYPCGTFSQAR